MVHSTQYVPAPFDSFSVHLMQSLRMSSCTSVHSEVVRNVCAGSCSAYGTTDGTDNMLTVVVRMWWHR